MSIGECYSTQESLLSNDFMQYDQKLAQESYENSVPFSYPMAEDQWMPAIHKGNQCVQCSINQEFLSQMNTMAFQVNQIFMNQNQINEVTPRTSNLESQPASSMLISTEEKIVERNKNLEYVKTILGVENQEFITETEGDYCHPTSQLMGSIIDYVIKKSQKVNNTDLLCCTCWKFVTVKKRKTRHKDHDIVGKRDYAANQTYDKIEEIDIANLREVTLRKITALAKKYKHMKGDLIKKISQEKQKGSECNSTFFETSQFTKDLSKKANDCGSTLDEKISSIKQNKDQETELEKLVKKYKTMNGCLIKKIHQDKEDGTEFGLSKAQFLEITEALLAEIKIFLSYRQLF